MGLSLTGDCGAARETCSSEQFKLKARRARLRSSRSRLHVRSLRRSLRASAPRPLAAPGRDVRDRPDLLGGRPGINSGPHSPRAVVPRSNVWSLRPDAGFDSPRASLNGDAPVGPLGDGQSPSSEGVPPSGGSGCQAPSSEGALPREKMASVPRRFFGSMTVPARKSCKIGRCAATSTMISPSSHVLTEIGTG